MPIALLVIEQGQQGENIVRVQRIIQMQAILLAAATSVYADKPPVEARLATELVPLGCVFFNWDSAQVRAEFKDKVGKITDFSKQHPNAMIVIDGHTDPTGSAAYNAALGVRRARAVKSALTTAGVDESRIVMSSYGENAIQAGANNAFE